jgi:hypothetical protein
VNERAGGDFPHKCAQIRKESGQIAACSCVGVGGCESVCGWNGMVTDRAGCYIIIYNTKEESPKVFLCTGRRRRRGGKKVLYMCTARNLWASNGSEGGVLCGGSSLGSVGLLLLASSIGACFRKYLVCCPPPCRPFSYTHTWILPSRVIHRI